MFRSPCRRRVAVLPRRGKLVLGRQSVVDGQHGTLRAVREQAAQIVVRFDATDHPAASVEEDDGRLIGRSIVRIKSRRDVAVRSGDRQIFDASDSLRRRRQPRECVLGTRLLRRKRPQLRQVERRDLIEDRPHLRMEWHLSLLALLR